MIFLHIGAHKTASTHLQLALERARAALAGRGIALFGPDQLRRRGLGLIEYLAAGRADPATAAMLRSAFAVSATRLVLTDENILGMAHGAGMIREARFYPGAEMRLTRLLDVLPDAPVTVALAVRNPADYLISAHAQRLMSGRLEPFADFVGTLDPAALRWAELVGRLQRALPGARWVLWPYEEYPGVASQILAEMLGAEAALARPGPGVAHPGLSARAIAAALALNPRLPEAELRLAVRELRARFPKGADFPGPQPFSAATRQAVSHAYAADCTALAGARGHVWLPRAAGEG